MRAADGGRSAAKPASRVRKKKETEQAPVSRLARRKAATRQALLDAGRRMLAEGTAATASIQDITAAADVGFGTFYLHFDDKDELFAAAAEQVLERWGDYLDHAPPESNDPAVVFVTAFRRSARLLTSHLEEARLVCQNGFQLLGSSLGLAPRARRDLLAAVKAGRFVVAGDNVELAMSKTAGYLFALLHTWLVDRSSVDPKVIDDAAEELLRIFGIKPAEARRLAHARLDDDPLPADLL